MHAPALSPSQPPEASVTEKSLEKKPPVDFIDNILKKINLYKPKEFVELAQTITQLEWRLLSTDPINANNLDDPHDPTPKTTAKITWIFLRTLGGTFSDQQKLLKETLCFVAKQNLERFEPKDLVSIVRVFDDIEYHEINLFRFLSRKISSCASRLDPEDIAWTLFSFRKITPLPKLIFLRLTVLAFEKIHLFNAQELAITFKALVQASYCKNEQLSRISYRIKNKVNDLTVSDAIHVLWAYAYDARQNKKDPCFVRDSNWETLEQLKEVFLKNATSLNADEIVRIAWSYHFLNYIHEDLLRELCKHLEPKINDLTNDGLINITKIFISLNFIDKELLWKLLKKIEDKVVNNPHQFTPSNLSELTHAMLMGYCQSEDYTTFILNMLDVIFQIDPSRWEAHQLSQIHTIHLIYTLKSKQEKAMPIPLQERIDIHLKGLKDKKPISSDFHLSVAKCIENILGKSEKEFQIETYFVDIAYPARKLVIEVDGPAHFDQFGNYLQKNAVKEFVLKLLGWQVIRISKEWPGYEHIFHNESTSLQKMPTQYNKNELKNLRIQFLNKLLNSHEN
ncbi:RAP domain-containing protein [Parachlamydia sp.]|uniref:RAP domain-containing protein n=1 Tax=Parachlamydia sp. TaxID=2052048 RepID=UPI003D139195